MTFSLYWNSHQIPYPLFFGTWCFHDLIEKGKNLKHEFSFVLSYFLLYFLMSEFREKLLFLMKKANLLYYWDFTWYFSANYFLYYICAPNSYNVHNLKWALNELLLNQAYLVSKIESYTSKDDGRLQARV